jgi:hypothetical protein
LLPRSIGDAERFVHDRLSWIAVWVLVACIFFAFGAPTAEARIHILLATIALAVFWLIAERLTR